MTQTKGLRRRSSLSLSTKQLVLHEAGYRCGNPACRSILTLDIHHLIPVADGGEDSPDNLLALCPNCHALHHRGHIASESIRSWKMLLLAMNQATDRSTLDILLTLEQAENLVVSGNGVLRCASLVAAGYVTVEPIDVGDGLFNTKWRKRRYFVDLTEKGRRVVEAWKQGDQAAVVLTGSTFSKNVSAVTAGGDSGGEAPETIQESLSTGSIDSELASESS
jgi:hypothetical protein